MGRTYKRDNRGRFAGGGGVIGGIRRATAARKQRRRDNGVVRAEHQIAYLSASLSAGDRGAVTSPGKRRRMERSRAKAVTKLAQLRVAGSTVPLPRERLY